MEWSVKWPQKLLVLWSTDNLGNDEKNQLRCFVEIRRTVELTHESAVL